jgi:hypothetical protein
MCLVEFGLPGKIAAMKQADPGVEPDDETSAHAGVSRPDEPGAAKGADPLSAPQQQATSCK